MRNKIFYHITLLDNLNSILKEGLIPNIGPQCLRCKNDNPTEKLIYLTDLKSIWKYKEALFPNCRSHVILQVNCNNFSLIKRKKFIEGIEIGCREVIPPKNIKIMCLISNYKSPYKAQEDITVYKQVSFISGFMYTPFMKCLLRETPTYKANVHTNTYHTIVSDGFIHAYTRPFYFPDETLIIGVIPKGTEFYIDANGREIAARYIRFNVPWYQRLAMNIRDLYEKLFN